MTDKEHEYLLPGEVAAAISTNRPQFITVLIGKVKKGHVLEQDHVVGVLEAFRDIVSMRADDNQRAQALERHLRMIDDATKGLETLQGKIRRAVHKIGSGEPLDPDEIE